MTRLPTLFVSHGAPTFALDPGRLGPQLTALGQALLKRWTDPEGGHDVARYAALLDGERARRAVADPFPDTSSRRPATRAEAAPLLGAWRDPWFGEVAICVRGEGVGFASARSPLLSGRLMRVGERWLIDWDDEGVDAEAWLHPPPRGARRTRRGYR